MINGLIHRLLLRNLSCESGASAVELALTLPVFILLLVIVTDFSLEQLAIAQIETATIAAAEYAANKDCNQAGMTYAASHAISPSYTKWLVSDLRVSASAYCACGVDSGALVTKGTDAPKCLGYFCGANVAAAPYVNIGVSANYRPIAPSFWWRTGLIPISYGIVVRTFGSSTDCSG